MTKPTPQFLPSQPETTALSQVGLFYNKEMAPSSLKEKFLFATFEIIAEKGAEALSASELIKKTESSKGALFHHFKTLDELCLASLTFFNEFVKDSICVKPSSNLAEFLSAFAEDSKKRQCQASYFHISHFFKDRAIRDTRFQSIMSEAFQIYSAKMTEYALAYLPAGTNEEKVKSIMIFFHLSMERIFYQSVVLNLPQHLSDQMPLLLEMVEAQFLKLSR
jgi:AcrR family transcriptional regulator